MGSCMTNNRVPEEIKEASRLTKEEWREFTKTVWHIANVTDKGHPAVFPEEIPLRLIKMFSFVGETVLDPFAGVGTTGKVALGLNRNAVLVDQSEQYGERMTADLAHVLTEATAKVITGDSRDLTVLSDESIDLVVTSPPYWDKADYGNGPDNLGGVSSYYSFLEEMSVVYKELFRVIRPGRKVCVVTANVNQYTEHGLLTFPIAADFVLLLRHAGFVMINEVIWSKDKTGGRWGSSGVQRPIFGSYPYPPNFLFKNVHEYILVFAKPSETLRKGPKVRNYDELMNQSITQEVAATSASKPKKRKAASAT